MNTQQGRAKSIFLNAVEFTSDAERCAYVETECAGDDGLRREVEQLLAHHERLGAFLEPTSAGLSDTAVVSATCEGPGTVIGPYRLLRPIGEGGMGVVYLAEQDKPVRRQLALKVIRPGLDSRQVIARFEAERQALALMDHPNIAHVFDGGETASGRPYFVMELVDGVPLTKYCDEHHLTLRQRLELFVPVCQAVQHAHQKGIIHRDVKPSNVLIALYDGRPVPKVIDFGVAKAAGQPLTEKTLVTGFGALVGTLEYMSPEQAELNNLDVDTRSDVYSLGVLLYELLTGTTPLERKRVKEAGLLEALRIIREEETPRPSTRLSTADELPSIAACRGVEPGKLSGLVRGELDWIVMKALEKDRNRRYETANGLAMDLQRYLHDEHVLACPPSVSYRLRKFVRRNKRVLATAAFVALAVLMAAGALGWAVRDRAARQASLAGQVSDAVAESRQLLEMDLLYEAKTAAKRAKGLLATGEASRGLHDLVEQLWQDLTMVEDLAQIRLEQAAVLVASFDDPGADPKYVDAFKKYGIEVESANRGEVAQWIAASAIRVELAVALDNWALARQGAAKLTGKPYEPDWKGLLAISRLADPDPLRHQLREALEKDDGEGLRKLAAAEKVHQLPPTSLVSLSKALSSSGQVQQAVQLMQKARKQHPRDFWINHELAHNLARTRPPQLDEAIRFYTAAVTLRPQSPGAHLNLGKALSDKGKRDEAIAEYREAIQLAPHFVLAYNNLATELIEKGAPDEALKELEQALRLKPDFAPAHTNKGRALWELGQRDEAIGCHRRALTIQPDYAPAHYNLGIELIHKGELDEAVSCLHRVVQLAPDEAAGHYFLGNALQKQKKLDEAIACFRRAIQLKPDVAEVHTNLGVALRDKRQPDEAIACFRQAIALKPDLFQAHLNLGNAFADKKKWDGAAASFRTAIKLRPDFALTSNNLGMALRKQGKLDDAIACFRQAVKLAPDDAEIQANLGNALSARRDFAAAEIPLREVVRLKPKDAQARVALGLVLYEQHKWAEAAAEYQQAVRLNPAHATAYYNLGGALRSLGQLAQAEAAFREASRLQPQFALAHSGLGTVLLEQGKLAEAETAYREFVRLEPNSAPGHRWLGDILRQQGKLAEAEKEYREAVRLRPDGPSRGTLAHVLYKQGKVADVEQLYRDAVRLMPNNADAYFQLGGALQQLRKWGEAIAAYEQAVRLKPDHAAAHALLAKVLAMCPEVKYRNGPRAVEAAKKAVELAPQSPWYWQMLGWAQYRAGAWQASIEALEKSCKLQPGGVGDAFQWFFLAMAHWQLSQKEQARNWYDKAMQKEKVWPEELRRIRAEAAELLKINDRSKSKPKSK